MNVIVLADVINDVYSNGIIKSRHKIDRRDFIVMCRAAKGSVARAHYIAEKQGGPVGAFVSDIVKAKEFKVINTKRGYQVVDFDFNKNKITKLPDGNGIVRVTPIDTEGRIDYNKNYSRAMAGSEWMYCTPEFLEDTGELIYIAMSNEIRLFGSNIDLIQRPEDGNEQVEMVYVSDDDDTDIPNDMCWEIINNVLGIVLRVEGFPVDKTDDQNPNVQQINSKISSAQVA